MSKPVSVLWARDSPLAWVAIVPATAAVAQGACLGVSEFKTMKKMNLRTDFSLLRQAGMLLLGLCILSVTRVAALAEDAVAPAQGVVRKGPSRDVVDEKSLRQQADHAAKRIDLVALQTRPLYEKAPSTESSLSTASIFIFDGEYYTILAVGSVLSLPTRLQSRVVANPQGDVLLWPDFLARNAAWLGAREVTLEMSRGDTKAAAAVMRELAAETRLVVAVYQGCPITVLEPVQKNEVPKAK
ncbi:MAG: hypothetical protein WCL08_05475 [Verrucomicrobiota bacterium]